MLLIEIVIFKTWKPIGLCNGTCKASLRFKSLIWQQCAGKSHIIWLLKGQFSQCLASDTPDGYPPTDPTGSAARAAPQWGPQKPNSEQKPKPHVAKFKGWENVRNTCMVLTWYKWLFIWQRKKNIPLVPSLQSACVRPASSAARRSERRFWPCTESLFPTGHVGHPDSLQTQSDYWGYHNNHNIPNICWPRLQQGELPKKNGLGFFRHGWWFHGVWIVDAERMQVCWEEEPWAVGVVRDSAAYDLEDHHEKSSRLTMMMACSVCIRSPRSFLRSCRRYALWGCVKHWKISGLCFHTHRRSPGPRQKRIASK